MKKELREELQHQAELANQKPLWNDKTKKIATIAGIATAVGITGFASYKYLYKGEKLEVKP